jgi:broad specificity phosphatase PhoE
MPTQLTLVCHGATAATRHGRFPLDEPLEERAVKHAASLTNVLRRADLVLTSPALRARQTAAGLSPEPVVDPEIRDCDYGAWCGRSIAEVQAGDPEGMAAWLADPSAAPHGGESLSGLCRRVGAWMDGRMRQNGRVIAVTHLAVIRAAILGVVDAPLSSFWRIDVEPFGVVDLRSDGVRWTMRAAAVRSGQNSSST